MGGSSELQFVELQGLRYIGLGALVDELSPKERVYDTLEQLRTRTERLISIGYLVDKHPSEHNHHQSSNSAVASTSKTTQTVPLDVWNINNRDTRQSMSKHVELIVELTKVRSQSLHKTSECFLRKLWKAPHSPAVSFSFCLFLSFFLSLQNKRFHALKEELTAQLRVQKLHSSKGHNRYLSGITAHNLGVLAVLTGKPEEAVSYFREAICLKETAFGRTDAEVALSWDELGIQFFARGDFDGALTSFREAHSVRNGLLQQQQQLQQLQQQQQLEPDSGVALSPAQHPSVAMVLNNMACCYFQMGNARQALLTLEEADEIQQRAVGSSVQAELDLLHVAIVICNCGYMKLALKQYEDARSLLEEALLIQQSVLDDHHRAVRDTLSNIEFANAFHS